MRLLLVHNRYQHPGGEDAAFAFEASLLKSAGHTVHQLIVSNDTIQSGYDRIRTALALPWNAHGFRLAADALSRHSPDVMHVHNTFPQLSPSVYDAAADAKVPIVQTLHNFRVTCANGILMRDGVPCEICVTRSPYTAVRFHCYRGSYLGSLAVARLIAAQKRQKYFSQKINRFVALSEFARSMFVRAGLPPERIVVKPNGTEDNGMREGAGSGALFVGRLSMEKGVQTLVEAAREVDGPFRIVGDGPLRARLESLAPPNVVFLGTLAKEAVLKEMAQARCLVLPSLSYEGFPVTLAEAYSVGLPVVATRLGSLDELVEHRVTGLKFAAGNVGELSDSLKVLMSDLKLAERLGHAARNRYEQKFRPDHILKSLESIYEAVVA